jgi:hypothetical protein
MERQLSTPPMHTASGLLWLSPAQECYTRKVLLHKPQQLYLKVAGMQKAVPKGYQLPVPLAQDHQNIALMYPTLMRAESTATRPAG